MCSIMNLKFINLYFKNFNCNQREYFISNFYDLDFHKKIKILTNLFTEYPFYHKSIIEETSSIDLLEAVTDWQRCYYLSIYKEYHRSIKNDVKYNFNLNNEIANLYKNLEYKNSSFRFLIKIYNVIGRDVDKLEKDELMLLRKLFSFSTYKSWDKDYKDEKEIKQSSELSQPEKDEIRKRAEATFFEMRNRSKDNLQ